MTLVASPVQPRSAQAEERLGFAESIGFKFVEIKPGEFWMGSAPEELDELDKHMKDYPVRARDHFKSQLPRHRVRITKPFSLSAHEVTVGQFRKFVEDTGYKTDREKRKGILAIFSDPKINWRNPGFKQDENHPVTRVSWNDATAFCAWLSRKEGRTVRLPTEAEWEYSCRAGTTTQHCNGDDAEKLAEVANMQDATYYAAEFPELSSPVKASDGYVFTAPVGKLKPNAWGLYDMHGNVFEWCQDHYDESYYKDSPLDDPQGPKGPTSLRMRRGGSFNANMIGCRSAHRGVCPPDESENYIGFRVVLVSPGS
jgi:formylglycine-generating enzyme required for sulfatase activity